MSARAKLSAQSVRSTAPAGGLSLFESEFRPEASLDLGGLSRSLWRQRGWCLAIFFGFVGAVVLGTLLIPKTYTTEAKLITAGSGSDTSANTDVPLLNAMLQSGGERSPEFYVELITQEPVARRVTEELNLHIAPVALLGHIKVRPVTNTALLRLDVSWTDPKTSAAIANKVGDVFAAKQREMISSQVGASLTYLDEKLPAAAAEMHTAERQLQLFQSAHRLVDVNAQTQAAVAELGSVQSRLSEAMAQRDQAKAQLAAIHAALSQTSTTQIGSKEIAANPVAAQLQSLLTTVDEQLVVARGRYTNDHPAVIGLREEQRQLKQKLAALPGSVQVSKSVISSPLYEQLKAQEATLLSQVASNDAASAALRGQLRAADPKLGELPRFATEVADLVRSAKAAEDFYNALKAKRNNAAVSRDAVLSDVTVAVPASAELAVVSPNLRQNVILAIVAGFLLAIGGAIVVETLDQTLRDEEGVEAALHAPILATIPSIAAGPRPAWLHSMWTESFIQLMSGLRYSTAEPLRILAITSPLPGDGKSLVALNAAISLAQIKPNILLIDADMRRSGMNGQLGIPARQGLAEVLVGLHRFDDVVQKAVHAGLDYLSSGASPPHSTKLLECPRFEQLIDEIRERYEFIVVDTPALAVAFDGSLVAAQADGTVMVVSAGKTQRRVATRVLDRLSLIPSVNFLGVVLNRAETSRMVRRVYLDYTTAPDDCELKTASGIDGHASLLSLFQRERR